MNKENKNTEIKVIAVNKPDRKTMKKRVKEIEEAIKIYYATGVDL